MLSPWYQIAPRIAIGVSGAIMPFQSMPGPQLASGGCHGNCGMGFPAPRLRHAGVADRGFRVQHLLPARSSCRGPRKWSTVMRTSQRGAPTITAYGSTPGRIDHAHRDVFALLNIARKVPGNRGELLRSFGARRNRPAFCGRRHPVESPPPSFRSSTGGCVDLQS